MSESRPPFPPLQVGASSYDADTHGAQSDTADATSIEDRQQPQPASPPAQGALASQLRPSRAASTRRGPRVRELLQQISARHNEFWELLLGPYAGSGWIVSLWVHAMVLACLGLLLAPVERKPPPRIITGGIEEDGAGQIGETLAEIEVEVPQATPVETAAELVATGGSQGDVLPGLAAAFGPTAGSGTGAGQGAGDAVGDEIAGRVEAAGGKGGRMQISIGWSDRNDLDLHLITATGSHVYHATPETPDGGKLDVDMNVGGESTQPVENITWENRQPPDGRYVVLVNYYSRQVGGPAESKFSVRVDLGGEVRVISSAIAFHETLAVAQFDIRDGRLASLETNLKPLAEDELKLSAAESKRSENREQAANELLADAKSTPNPRLRAGKLRRLIERFDNTAAATAARQLLEQSP